MEGDETDTRSAPAPESESEQQTLLLVEPDAGVRRSIVRAAEQEGVAFEILGVGGVEAAVAAVEEAEETKQAEEAVERSPIDCVVTEYDLPDGSVADLSNQLGVAGVDVPVVVFTARDPAEVSRVAFGAGVADFVQKQPGGAVEFLLDKVRGAVDRSHGTDRRGEAPGASQQVTLLDGSGAVQWASGSIPDVGTETPIDDVAAVLAEGDRFREALGRAAAEEEHEEWVWPRVEDGAIEHRGIPLPALEDVARLSILRDVSGERKRRAEHETFEQLLDTARDGLYTLDGNGYYRYVNRSMADQLGYDREELIGMHAGRILTGESYTEGQAEVQALVEDEERESEVLELTVKTATDERMPVAIHFAPLYEEDGSYGGLVGVMRDISARKEREYRLRESERRYRTLAENLPNGAVAMFDPSLTYTLVEGELFESLDYDVTDFEGTDIARVHDGAYVDRHIEKYELVFEGERAEFQFTHGGRVFRTHLVPIREAEGPVGAGLALILEVTERREHERELERQNRRLNEFASIVSHDLRNPLNVISGNLELFRETGDPDRLDRVAENVQRMETLIEELLELARGGRSVGETETVDLDALVDECWAGIETKGASLQRPAPLGSVQAGRTRLVQLLENLFRNAVEHGGGDVTVTVEPLPHGFSVADDGNGLPPDLGEEVFEYGVTRSDEGTGIGLAIVEEVANAHGWEVLAGESDAGGARFDIVGARYPDDADRF